MNAEVFNVAQRRQAIQRGLKQYFQGSSLERVLNYWEQEYSEKPAFVLNRFLNEICTTEDLKQHRKDMLKQVIHELSHLEKVELLKTDEDKTFVDSDDLYKAYDDFVNHVLDRVQLNDLEEFTTVLKQQLHRDKLSNALLKPYDNTAQALMQSLPMSQAAKGITTLYTVCCEFYGPQKTDHIYAQGKTDMKLNYPDLELQQLL